MRRLLQSLSSLLSTKTKDCFTVGKKVLCRRRVVTPLWVLSLILVTVLAVHLISTNMVQRSILDDRIIEIETARDANIELVKSANERTLQVLSDDTEMAVRKIMQSVLKGVKSQIEDDISRAPKPISYKELADIIYRHTHFITIYNTEGDYFALTYDNVNGWTFAMDESADCNSPVFAGVDIMTIPNRVRTIYDEVVWQAELTYVLNQVGLINNKTTDKYMTNKYFKVLLKKYDKVDAKLNTVSLYTADHVEYILKQYPELYKFLRVNNIIMHNDPRMAETVLATMTKTGDAQNLGWYFNPKPYKEILEYIYIPDFTGLFGGRKSDTFKNERSYQKVIVVSGAQIQTIMNEYEDTVKSIKLAEKTAIDAINRQANASLSSLKKAEAALQYSNNAIVLIIILSMVLTMWIILVHQSPAYINETSVTDE